MFLPEDRWDKLAERIILFISFRSRSKRWKTGSSLLLLLLNHTGFTYKLSPAQYAKDEFKISNIYGCPFRGFKSMGLEFDVSQTKLWNQFFFFFSAESLTLTTLSLNYHTMHKNDQILLYKWWWSVDNNFLTKFFFSDEADLTLGGYVNKQNCSIWGSEDP